jgi:hypothetical protein
MTNNPVQSWMEFMLRIPVYCGISISNDVLIALRPAGGTRGYTQGQL